MGKTSRPVNRFIDLGGIAEPWQPQQPSDTTTTANAERGDWVGGDVEIVDLRAPITPSTVAFTPMQQTPSDTVRHAVVPSTGSLITRESKRTEDSTIDVDLPALHTTPTKTSTPAPVAGVHFQDVHRTTALLIARRLLGNDKIASFYVEQAEQAVATTETSHTTPSPLQALVSETLDIIMDATPYEHATHYAHRVRLLRDLHRHDSRSRVVLALRHLGDLDIDDVTVACAISTKDATAITSEWLPRDGAIESHAILDTIDSWIGQGTNDTEKQRESLLRHLDS